MTLWHPDPPQGFSPEQELIIIGRPVSPRYDSPSGIAGGVIAKDVMAYDDGNIFAYDPANWYSPLWLNRIPLTIQSGQIPTTESDFAFPVSSVFPELIGASVNEIIFTDENDIPINHTIEDFNPATGALVAWVNAPTLSDATVIRLYYNNPNGIDPQDSTKVWESPHRLRYDMKINGGIVKDSTINNNDGVISGAIDTPGQIDRGLRFDGIDDNVMIPATITETGDWTISLWGSKLVISPNEYFIDVESGRFVIGVRGAMTVEVFDGATWHDTGVSVSDNLFHMVVACKVGANLKVFVDGILRITITAMNLGGNMALGSRHSLSDNFLDGEVDEVQIIGDSLTDDRILALYNSQKDSSTFYSIGAEESVPAPTDRMAYD